MDVRIRNFREVEGERVKGLRVLARFTAQFDHFRLSDLKVMECPDKGLMIWATRNVRLSMEGRAEILRKIIPKIAEVKGLGPR